MPEATTPPFGARVMDLQNPVAKMSKSVESSGSVQLLDDPDIISRKFKRAVTDSENEVRYDPTVKPGVSNLLEILSAATGQKPDELAKGYTQYGLLKTDAADAVIELLTPVQARYRELAGDPGELASLLRKGADKARTIASATLQRAYDAVGFLPAYPTSCRREPHRSPDHRLAVPALGSLAVEPLYVLVDTVIVGRLGTAQLGGLALAATVLALVVAGCNFLTYGTTERVARRLGAGERAAAADVGVQTMWLSTIVGLVLAPLVALLAPLLAGWLGGTGEVFDFGVTYLRIGAIGVPFVIFALGAQGVQRGAADYRSPLVVLLVANLVNAVLEVLFVFGFDWGVPGSAWSTVIAQVGAGVAFAVLVRRHLAAATDRRPSRAGMAPLLTAGRHLLLRVGSMLAVTTGATAIAARVDEPTLAAHQIVASMFLFLALVLDALAIPAQTLVADELGQGSVDGAAELSHRCVRLSIIAGAAIAVVLAALAPVLPEVFSAILRSTAGRRRACGGSPRCSCRRRSPSPTTGC